MAQDGEEREAGIGDPEIDRQHQTFLDALEQCCQQAARGGQADFPPALLEELKAHAASHFRFEEALLGSCGFPGLAGHQAQHRHFEALLARLEVPPQQGRGASLAEAFSGLRNWALHHIGMEDQRYKPYLKKPL